MFCMIRHFFSLRNPWGGYGFPCCLWKWPKPMWLMLKDLWRWIVRGYPDCFTWSIDITVAHFMLPLVKHLKELDFGVPGRLMPEYGIAKKEYEEGRKAAHTKWQDIQSKIIYSLDSLIKDGEMEAYEEAELAGKDINGRGEAVRKEQEKVEEGCKLLGEYFTNLWW